MTSRARGRSASRTRAWYAVESREVYASSDPPRASRARAISWAERRSVPLNTMCSSRCDTPILGRGSWALAVRTHTPIAAERTVATRSESTVTPFGAVVRWISRSSRTVSIGRLVFLEQRLPGQLHAAALVHLEQLDPHVVAPLDDILGFFGAAVLQLGDVEQALDARGDLDERPERRGALHDALVDLADLGLLNEARNHVARPLAPLADRRDGDQAGVVHIDLGARLLLDPADRLALGPDQVADLFGADLHRDDPRRVLGELRARRRDRLLHDVEDVQPGLLGFLQGFADDLEIEPLDLDVHLDRGDPFARPGDLEVHVAQVLLAAEDVRQDRDALAFLDETHRDARAGGLDRHAGVVQRQRPSTHRGHRRRTVRLENVRDNPQGVGELLIGRQDRLNRALGQGAVPHLAPRGAANRLHFTR